MNEPSYRVGVGKGSICNMLISKYPQHLAVCVSHTTRKPRPNEVNGVHYHFVGNEVCGCNTYYRLAYAGYAT